MEVSGVRSVEIRDFVLHVTYVVGGAHVVVRCGFLAALGISAQTVPWYIGSPGRGEVSREDRDLTPTLRFVTSISEAFQVDDPFGLF